MTVATFKEGDQIVVTEPIPPTPCQVGQTGTVLKVWPHAEQMEIRWDSGVISFLFTTDPVEIRR